MDDKYKKMLEEDHQLILAVAEAYYQNENGNGLTSSKAVFKLGHLLHNLKHN